MIRIINSVIHRLKTQFGRSFRDALKVERALYEEAIKLPPHTENRSYPVVMIIGPRHISGDAKHARLQAVEDLFKSLMNAADINWVTSGFSPDMKDEIDNLCTQYGVKHHITENPLTLSGRKDISLYQAYQIASSIRPDVITNISGYLKFGRQATMIGRALSTRTVIRVPGDEVRSRELKKSRKRKNDRYIENKIFNRANHLMAMSADEKKRLSTIAPETDITIVKRGVDMGLFKAKPLTPLKERAIQVIFIGRNSQEKGRDFLYKLIEASDPESIKFTLVGNFDPHDPVWGKAHIYNSVAVKDMPAIYEAADLLVSCSITEGFPQIFAESLSCGRPILMPDTLLPGEFEGANFVYRSALSVDHYIKTIELIKDRLSLEHDISGQAEKHARQTLSNRLWQAGYRRLVLQS